MLNIKQKKFARGILLLIVLVLAVSVIAVRAGNKEKEVEKTAKTTRKVKTFDDPAANEYKSKVDHNGDGVDDQTAILHGALAYVKTKPRYVSRYYRGGWPTDDCGVCTDVVNYGLKNAGYNMRTLLNADVKKHPGWYKDIRVQDEDIDFRRVENLYVYFKHHAKSITTDIHKTKEWQGGDIVVFKEHIGVVSAKRDKNGITYIIHHGKPKQKGYIQDILPKKENEIIGHFRVS